MGHHHTFYITTSGMCSNGALTCAIQELGEERVLFSVDYREERVMFSVDYREERVMFSVDYPYESSEIAAQFIERASFHKKILEKICVF